jgi:hypothetical protein
MKGRCGKKYFQDILSKILLISKMKRTPDGSLFFFLTLYLPIFTRLKVICRAIPTVNDFH